MGSFSSILRGIALTLVSDCNSPFVDRDDAGCYVERAGLDRHLKVNCSQHQTSEASS